MIQSEQLENIETKQSPKTLNASLNKNVLRSDSKRSSYYSERMC